VSGVALLNGSVRPPWEVKKSVLVGGCFDIFHYGHLQFLLKARTKGEALVVALEGDEFIRTRKKRDPFHTHAQRAAILSQLRVVDYVVMMPYLSTDDEYDQFTRILKPSVIAVTDGDSHLQRKQTIAHKVGAKLVVVTKLLEGFSSSHIRTYASVLYD
jgi:cytidyltransferase-like protein